MIVRKPKEKIKITKVKLTLPLIGAGFPNETDQIATKFLLMEFFDLPPPFLPIYK
jgi:hypothetical protein